MSDNQWKPTHLAVLGDGTMRARVRKLGDADIPGFVHVLTEDGNKLTVSWERLTELRDAALMEIKPLAKS